MFDGSEILGGSDKIASGLLFMGAATMTLDVASALNSSPWTAESFGSDPHKREALKFYVWQGVFVTAGFTLASALLSGNPWPIIGGIIANAYLIWIYYRALNRAQASGSTSWQDQGTPTTCNGTRSTPWSVI